MTTMTAAPRMTKPEMARLFKTADEAGRAAAEATTPEPMIVGKAIGLSSQMDPTRPIYFVPSGICGFAWVTTTPGTSRFARWVRAKGKGSTDSFNGGTKIRVRGYGQSLEKKEAYAQAFAGVLRDAGIAAYPGSRMD